MTPPALKPSKSAGFPSKAAAAPVSAAIFLAALCLSIAPALAQDPGGAPPKTYENQPPLTDADVPALTEFLIDLDGNTRRWDEIVAKYQLEETRIAYLVNKYIGGLWLLDPNSGFTEESLAQAMKTPLAVPTAEELEVIRRNSPQIEAARKDAQQNEDEDGDGEDDDGGDGDGEDDGDGGNAPPVTPGPPRDAGKEGKR
ncbi:MAG: hypothetical protein LBQ12_11395 [Deltaproteobacteria bacterium]|nr:hypothetical protein [Deltaproteobacteria bacterium]